MSFAFVFKRWVKHKKYSYNKKCPSKKLKVKKKNRVWSLNPPKVNKPSRILRFKVVKLLCPEITLSLFVNTVTAHPSTKPKKGGKFRA